MRVATKVAAGSVFLLVLLGGILVYHVLLVRQLARMHSQVAAIQLGAATEAVALVRDLDLLDRHARKWLVTADRRYANRLRAVRRRVERRIARLERLPLTPAEARHLEAMTDRWEDLAPRIRAPAELVRLVGEEASVDQLLGEPVGALLQQGEALVGAIRAAIAAQAREATEAAERTELLALIVAASAFVASVGLVLLNVHAIRHPLRRLVAGTRAVAAGEFSYQIESSGDDEFSRVATAFNTMVRRLDELDRMKKDFLSLVSHELKNPLVAMQETSRLLIDGTPGPLNDKQRRLLELSLQSSERLSGMIINLLDLSRMESGAIEYSFDDRDLPEIVATVTSEFEARAREARLAVDVDIPAPLPPVRCDGDRILQVLVNLLDNAIRHTPAGGSVTVAARTVSRSAALRQPAAGALAAGVPAWVQVSVADTGPGIPDEEKPRIFERFHQVGRRERRAMSGVGLGLSICREIVDAHGGALWVEDRPGGGSVFSFLLPASTGAQAEADDPRRSSAA
jgi:signal transduction histidine kinase